MQKHIIILIFSMLTVLAACTNPFAPGLTNEDSSDYVLGDQKTIDGFFKNFRYAYIFKDTLVYGSLLKDNFTFIYRDYDQGVDKSWGRDEDMLTTWGLFQASQSLDLFWNDAITSIGDSLNMEISRSFSLTIEFNPTDIIRIQGRANLRLVRNSTNDNWEMSIWRDESNY
jgi:hypothetical protein